MVNGYERLSNPLKGKIIWYGVSKEIPCGRSVDFSRLIEGTVKILDSRYPGMVIQKGPGSFEAHVTSSGKGCGKISFYDLSPSDILEILGSGIVTGFYFSGKEIVLEQKGLGGGARVKIVKGAETVNPHYDRPPECKEIQLEYFHINLWPENDDNKKKIQEITGEFGKLIKSL